MKASKFFVRIAIRPTPASPTVELWLLGHEDLLKHVIVFERACLDRHAVTDVRAWLAKPLAKLRIEQSGSEPFAVPSVEIL